MTRRAAQIVLAAGLLALPALPALAQQVQSVRVTSSFGGPGDFGSSSRVNRRGLDKYSDILSLTADQKSLAQSLLESYEAGCTSASKEFQAGREEMTRSYQETQDESIFAEKMPKLRKDYMDKTKSLEKGLFADLKALLTPEQESKWPKVERARRRETTLRVGIGSGETVDLINVVEGLKLSPEVMKPLTEPLDDYEIDLDRALVSKQATMNQTPSFEPGKPISPDEWKERMAKAREEGLKVRDINQRHARLIEAQLPEDKRAEFQKAVRQATYPQVYRPSVVTKKLDAALGLSDLEPQQREALQTLRTNYQRDSGPINDRWASAIEDADRSGKNSGGAMAIAGGGMMSISFGDDNEKSPTADARKARRELDDRTKEKMGSILTKDQQAKLPKETPMMDGEFHGDFMPADGVAVAPIVIRKDVESDKK